MIYMAKLFANLLNIFLSYVLSFQNVIDILALIPFYIWIGLWLASGEKWRTIEIVGSIVQILRILRIFKLRSLSNPYVQLMFQSVVRK
jgi:hypothetical protein